MISDCKNIQSIVLKLSTGGKQNDIVIVNYKKLENTKINIHNHVREESGYTYVHTYIITKYRTRNMFYDKVISI